MTAVGKVRYAACFVIWLTLFTFYTMRSNMSIAMLAMTKQTVVANSTSFSSCIEVKNDSEPVISHNYPFDWTQHEQGLILSAFFVGYLSCHLIGAILSMIVGPRVIMIICLIGATGGTFSMILLPYMGVWYFVAGRALIGFFSGPLYPIVHQLIANYAPEFERTTLTTITHTGNIIGLCFNFGVGGYIVEHFENGWKYLFYMNGFLGIITLILWMILVFSTPEEHPLMSKSEVILIKGKNYQDKSHHMSLKDVPFTKMLFSIQIYIICLATFANSIILFALLTGYPKYLSSVYGIKKSTASYLSIIPFLSNFIFQLFYPNIFNYNKVKDSMSKTTYRRINSTVGYIGSAVFLAPVGFLPCEYMKLSIILISLSMTFLGANQPGFFTAMIDLSPRLSGMLMGLASTFGSLSGVIQPQITSMLIADGDRKLGYTLAFVITAVISLTLGTPFILFGQSENQGWDDEGSSEKKDVGESLLLEAVS